MRSVTADKAQEHLDRLLDEVAESSEPIRISGTRSGAVLVSDDEWRAIEETLYLLSIPGMRESIIEGMETSIEDCDEDPGWCARRLYRSSYTSLR